MGLLSKNSILKVDDLKTEKVAVPEWGGDVLVSEMGADARDEFEQWLTGQRGEKAYVHIRAALVACTVVDEKKERLFGYEDIATLGKKNGLVLDRIFDAANRLNKIYGAAREGVEKNSETPRGDSGDGA